MVAGLGPIHFFAILPFGPGQSIDDIRSCPQELAVGIVKRRSMHLTTPVVLGLAEMVPLSPGRSVSGVNKHYKFRQEEWQ